MEQAVYQIEYKVQMQNGEAAMVVLRNIVSGKNLWTARELTEYMELWNKIDTHKFKITTFETEKTADYYKGYHEGYLEALKQSSK